MTTEERTTVARVLWRSVRALVPRARQVALEELQTALDSVYADHAEACLVVGYRDGCAQADQRVAEAREESFRSGMLAVRKRSDYRDLDDIQDPEELRSTH